jgi:hypothetical protein
MLEAQVSQAASERAVMRDQNNRQDSNLSAIGANVTMMSGQLNRIESKVDVLR